jgi:A/G-specific adenine glycosylase
MLASLPTNRLLRWANRHGRRPPWRTRSDPYALACAEILLQKTRASDVEPVWDELIRRYPDAVKLARARRETIERLVGHLGLGKQRAGRLKAMAAALANSNSGSGSIPGIGPYGSGIVGLAVGDDPLSPPIDGNIARIVCRYWGLAFERGEPRKKPDVRQAVTRALSTQSTPRAKLRLVYALVDLGEAVCRPQNPLCSKCPLRVNCRWANSDASR